MKQELTRLLFVIREENQTELTVELHILKPPENIKKKHSKQRRQINQKQTWPLQRVIVSCLYYSQAF